MKNLMNIVMLSCKKASSLIEKQSSDNLSFREDIQLKVHTLFCKTCAAYQRQSKAIDSSLSKWVKTKKDQSDAKLSEEIKSNILKEIKKS